MMLAADPLSTSPEEQDGLGGRHDCECIVAVLCHTMPCTPLTQLRLLTAPAVCRVIIYSETIRRWGGGLFNRRACRMLIKPRFQQEQRTRTGRQRLPVMQRHNTDRRTG